MKFACKKCGSCCHEYEFAGNDEVKRIPVFPDELTPLENYALEHGVAIKFLEDVVFPDMKNEKIVVITYKIVLEGKDKACPFFKEGKGCMVNEIKPIACKAYPLAQKRQDAFHVSMDIDPYCKFIEDQGEFFKNIDPEEVKNAFDQDFTYSRLLMDKNQGIILKLKELELRGRISIPTSIDKQVLDKALKSWDREYLHDL